MNTIQVSFRALTTLSWFGLLLRIGTTNKIGKRSDFDLSQLLPRYLVGEVVQIISLELEMHIFRSYHVKLIHLMVRSLSCSLRQNSIVWHLLIVEKCILGDLEEGAVWGILILTYTGKWSI